MKAFVSGGGECTPLLLYARRVNKNCEIRLLEKLIMDKSPQTSTLITGSLKTV